MHHHAWLDCIIIISHHLARLVIHGIDQDGSSSPLAKGYCVIFECMVAGYVGNNLRTKIELLAIFVLVLVVIIPHSMK